MVGHRGGGMATKGFSVVYHCIVAHIELICRVAHIELLYNPSVNKVFTSLHCKFIFCKIIFKKDIG